MSDREADVPTRLRTAALALFRERGYDRTTAAEIAAQAGVTERTFFRYFPDKREVLFDGEAVVRTALVASIVDAPAGLGPLDTLLRACRSFQSALEDNRPCSKPRHEVISSTPALQERELAKIDALAHALSGALRSRDVEPLRADLAARAGMVVFVNATLGWLDDPTTSFGERINLAGRELKALLNESD